MKALAGLDIPMSVDLTGAINGLAHDERTGMGNLWIPAERTIQGKAIDIDALCDDIETRFGSYSPRYRPPPLKVHPRVTALYRSGRPTEAQSICHARDT